MRTVDDMASSTPRRRTGKVILGVVVGVIFFALVFLRSIAVFYTDYLWFESVNLSSVWSGVLTSKVFLGVVAVLLSSLIVWVNLYIVDRVSPTIVNFTAEDELARQFRRVNDKHKRWIRLGASLAVGLVVGAGFAAYWNEWMLFMNGGSFGATDPQFNMDIGFFVFKLPFLLTVARWLFVAVAFAVVVSLVSHYLHGAIRPHLTKNKLTSAVKTHIVVLVGFLALIRAAQYWLDRYNLSYSTRGPDIVGANYTDVNVLMPAYILLTLISVLAAIVLFVSARTKAWTWPITTVGLWLVVSIVVGSVVPAAVQRLRVAPAESQTEAPYIQRNVDSTRVAMDLEKIDVNDFQYSPELTAADLENNAQTVRNIRLWDTDLVGPSYKRLQESRSYFQFADIDIDRYEIGGENTQMMLSVRELNTAGLPQDRQSWVNQHLAYTHGYGAVASPANAVTANGEPEFTVKDLPPEGAPAIEVPQVYFGERTSNYSIVNTDQGEVDFTSADGTDQTSKYAGTGGVELSNIFKRAAFAARVGAIEPLISNLVTPESKAMYLTNLRQRQHMAAPFLKFDTDPYAVIVDGRIKWVQDAYTTTAFYPYGQMADTSLVPAGSNSLSDTRFNYVRNSVKIVTDAYDGDMTFHVVDQEDPIIEAWEKAFPALFTDEALPQSIVDHVRYPEDLFRTQATMFGSYHLTTAQDFYSKSDRWNIAQRPSVEAGSNSSTTAAPVIQSTTSASSARGETRIEPTYMLMRLPGEERESFIMIQPFVPFSADDSRKELSAFMVAKSDSDQYGQMQTFVMPRGQQIDGPALVEARIQSDPDISQYITLLSRAGSRVALGDMLIIPIENTLMYVRPLYVQAESTQVPEFKKAIVVQGDNIAMEDTLQGALSSIFGAAPDTREAGLINTDDLGDGATPAPNTGSTTTTTAAPAAAGPVSAEAAALLDQANTEFAAADQALRQGNLAEYQARVQAGIELVRRARG